MASRRSDVLAVIALPALLAGVVVLLLGEGVVAAAVTALCVAVAVGLGYSVHTQDEARDPASPVERMLRREFDERVEQARARQARVEATRTRPSSPARPDASDAARATRSSPAGDGRERREAGGSAALPNDRPPASAGLEDARQRPVGPGRAPIEPVGNGRAAHAGSANAPPVRPDPPAARPDPPAGRSNGERRWTRSLRSAAQLVAVDPGLAVVAARDAVALHVELAFRDLLRSRCPPDLVERLLPCLPDRTFADARTRELWKALTGAEIRDAPAWDGFVRCCALRDEAVHRGARIQQRQAEEALAACARLLEHVDGVVAETWEPALGARVQEAAAPAHRRLP